MKKGQTEILGLLVIVILAVIIIGLVIAFVVGGTGKDRDTLRKNLQTTKMSDAILQYTPECPGEVTKDLRKIIKDCDFTTNNQICGQSCKELISTESKNIMRSVESKQPLLTYGLSIKKGENVLAVSECTGNTILADNYNDPAFTLLLKQCSK